MSNLAQSNPSPNVKPYSIQSILLDYLGSEVALHLNIPVSQWQPYLVVSCSG